MHAVSRESPSIADSVNKRKQASTSVNKRQQASTSTKTRRQAGVTSAYQASETGARGALRGRPRARWTWRARRRCRRRWTARCARPGARCSSSRTGAPAAPPRPPRPPCARGPTRAPGGRARGRLRAGGVCESAASPRRRRWALSGARAVPWLPATSALASLLCGCSPLSSVLPLPACLAGSAAGRMTSPPASQPRGAAAQAVHGAHGGPHRRHGPRAGRGGGHARRARARGRHLRLPAAPADGRARAAARPGAARAPPPATQGSWLGFEAWRCACAPPPRTCRPPFACVRELVGMRSCASMRMAGIRVPLLCRVFGRAEVRRRRTLALQQRTASATPELVFPVPGWDSCGRIHAFRAWPFALMEEAGRGYSETLWCLSTST
jgi:hypothetical protein